MASKAWEQYQPEMYDPDISRVLFPTKAAVRSEYARLRRAANQRLSRLEAAGFGDSKILERYGGEFGSSRGMTEAQLRAQLRSAAHFMSLQTSTVSGQRERRAKMLSKLHEHGYDFVNEQNAGDFERFMEAAKDHYGKKTAFDSVQLIELFEQVVEQEADIEAVKADFDFWTQNQNMKNLPKPAPEDVVPEALEEMKAQDEKREARKAARRERSAQKKRQERKAAVEQKRTGRKGRRK